MAIPRILKDFNLFVDGRGYLGKVPELTLPKLTRKMNEYRAGGMAGPVEIDMGLEKLECDFSLIDYAEDVLRLWGLQDHAAVALRFTGSIESDDATAAVVPVEVTLRGRWKELDFGGWKPGEDTPLKVQLAASYYRYKQGGRELIEIDMVNMVEKVDGVDRLAERRAALGI